MKKREVPQLNIGITLIVLIFMNLCLITFSVLSLQNAVSDRNLTKKTAEYTTAYYEAYSQIEEEWQKVDQIVSQVQEEDAEDCREEIRTRLQEEGYNTEENREALYISCAYPVSEHQELYGRAKIEIETEENTGRVVADQLRLQSNGTWEADRSVNVYQNQQESEK